MVGSGDLLPSADPSTAFFSLFLFSRLSLAPSHAGPAERREEQKEGPKIAGATSDEGPPCLRGLPCTRASSGAPAATGVVMAPLIGRARAGAGRGGACDGRSIGGIVACCLRLGGSSERPKSILYYGRPLLANGPSLPPPPRPLHRGRPGFA